MLSVCKSTTMFVCFLLQKYPFPFHHVNTVEPQSYGLHSYGILGQPDTDIEYIFGKYHQNFYKMGTGHQV